MATEAKFLFHLDEPREQFRAGRRRVRGWIATHEPLAAVRLCGPLERALENEERPDVRRAFPNFACARGFVGAVGSDELRGDALHFAFDLGGVRQTAFAELPAPPTPPGRLRRAWLQLRRDIALRRLRGSSQGVERWNAARDAFLLEVEMTRGGDFRRPEGDRLIALFAEHYPNAVVVQIGANDGLHGDPLVAAFAETQWSGVLVEPVPYLAATLRERYRGRAGIGVEQAAISRRDGEAPLYRLAHTPGQTPEWFSHLATLDRAVLLKQRDAIPEIESLIIEERVPTLSFETLVRRHALARIDLLVIDTEGHDFEILREFDFVRFRPALLMFEHQHLSPADKAAAYALISAHQYAFREMPEGDTIAWQTR